MSEICSKLTIKTPDVSIVNFEHVNVDWYHKSVRNPLVFLFPVGKKRGNWSETSYARLESLLNSRNHYSVPKVINVAIRSS